MRVETGACSLQSEPIDGAGARLIYHGVGFWAKDSNPCDGGDTFRSLFGRFLQAADCTVNQLGRPIKHGKGILLILSAVIKLKQTLSPRPLRGAWERFVNGNNRSVGASKGAVVW